MPVTRSIKIELHPGFDLGERLLTNNSLKIVSFIDVSCPSCLARIKSLKIFATEISRFNIPIILICQSEDNFELFKYLCEKREIAELSFPFYLDTKNQFFAINKFLDPSPASHTVLADKNNKVLVTGDMTLDANVKKEYLDTIKANNKN